MNLSSPEIITQIRHIVGSKILSCPPQEVQDAAIRNLDSIGRITLMVELENEFNVELTTDEYDLAVFESLENLARFVLSKKS